MAGLLGLGTDVPSKWLWCSVGAGGDAYPHRSEVW
jgi:hypothetical protein